MPEKYANKSEINKFKERAKNVWGASPAGSVYAKDLEKGTKEFFEKSMFKRFSYECDWLDDLVQFKSFKNKKVLEIGCGSGYDAYMFCKNGADYTGIDLTPKNIERSTKHLSYYGFFPTILEVDAAKMLFVDEFDFVYSFGVLHHIPEMDIVLKKIYQTLKSGGEAQILVYNKNSIFYRWFLLFNRFICEYEHKKTTMENILSQIEYTTADCTPYVKVYTRSEIKNKIKAVGFKIQSVDIRKLTEEDIPEFSFLYNIRFFWRFAGFLKKFLIKRKNLMYFLSKRFGWYISVRCKKL